MATNQLNQVIQTLRGATLPFEETGLTDGQLLESYIRSREETALAALVRRHGPMVWGVCSRVLRGHHDAEDAFQATFLVLVRKAASIAQRDKLANWLYGVAHQTALKARATGARRSAREKQVAIMPEPVPPRQELWHELHGLLDQELSRLPDKYRAVIVLCDLEGKTRKDAARHFRLPEGTVASRLATARSMLAKRLARAGLMVSGAVLGTVLTRQGASASVPLQVASTTIKAASLFAAGQVTAPGVLSVKAVALAQGALKTMLLTKLKIATAVLVTLAVLSAGATALAHHLLSGPPPSTLPPQAPVVQPPKEKAVLAQQPANQSAPPKKELTGPPLQQNKADETKPTFVHGVVKAVDASKNTLTVVHKDGETTYSVAPDAKINIDLKPGNLAALPPGANVTLSQFVDARTVGGIQAGGASIFAGVGAVDIENSTISVSGGPCDGRTYRVTKDTYISIDDKKSTLAAIPKGASLHALNLCADQQTAHSINVTGPGFHHIPVKAVDVEKSTITFDAMAPAQVAGKTFPVPSDARIMIDDRPGKLADVPAGSFVNLGLSADQQTARLLHAEGPHLGGCGGSPVKAVDAVNNTITFDDKAPADIAGKTFTLAQNAGIQIDFKPGKLTDLPTGSYVNVILSVDRQTVRQLHAQGPHVGDCGGCLVKAVDVEKNTITFDDKASIQVAGKTFKVARHANIVIDGKLGKLTDLPVGSYVDLGLCVDQLTAHNVNAQGPAVPGVGVVSAVDVANSTITVNGTTYPVAKNANIIMDGQGSLANVPNGAQVSLRLCVDRKTVGTIHVNAK
jgi:RNA polymerase sigma factor (sigma-70 family)